MYILFLKFSTKLSVFSIYVNFAQFYSFLCVFKRIFREKYVLLRALIFWQIKIERNRSGEIFFKKILRATCIEEMKRECISQ